jgi:hypothetical protein
MVLLPVAARQLEPHSELETVQYCSFWWAVALHVPWRHEKISSVDFATGREAIRFITPLSVPGSCSAPNRRAIAQINVESALRPIS